MTHMQSVPTAERSHIQLQKGDKTLVQESTHYWIKILTAYNRATALTLTKQFSWNHCRNMAQPFLTMLSVPWACIISADWLSSKSAGSTDTTCVTPSKSSGVSLDLSATSISLSILNDPLPLPLAIDLKASLALSLDLTAATTFRPDSTSCAVCNNECQKIQRYNSGTKIQQFKNRNYSATTSVDSGNL